MSDRPNLSGPIHHDDGQPSDPATRAAFEPVVSNANGVEAIFESVNKMLTREGVKPIRRRKST